MRHNTWPHFILTGVVAMVTRYKGRCHQATTSSTTAVLKPPRCDITVAPITEDLSQHPSSAGVDEPQSLGLLGPNPALGIGQDEHFPPTTCQALSYAPLPEAK